MKYPRRPSLSTLLLCATLALSSFASASPPVSLVPANTLNPDYCAHQATGTATYLLSNATTGTASASVDVGLYGCFYMNITQTGGGAPVRIWWNDISTTYTAGTSVTAGTMWGQAIAGSQSQRSAYAIAKVARYFSVDTPPSTGVPYAALGVTPTAIKTSVWLYFPTNWPY
jgi:hypothetical protein